MRPIVGITSYAEDARWGVWEVAGGAHPARLRRRRRGGRRPSAARAAERRTASRRPSTPSTGLMLSGGADLDPASYGAEAHPETNGIRPERDERRACAPRGRARARHARAGRVPRKPGAERRAAAATSSSTCPRWSATRATSTRPASSPTTTSTCSRARSCTRSSASTRRSRATITRATAASATASARPPGPSDGTVEAIEDPARRFALGVLWHPEEGEDAALFQALVDEAKRYREERR